MDNASHDFDVISHENCSYDTDKGFNINVDEILNGKEPEVMTEEYMCTVSEPVFTGDDRGGVWRHLRGLRGGRWGAVSSTGHEKYI